MYGYRENKPPHRYLPPNAIWFQTSESMKASITLANDAYAWEVYERVTGELICGGVEKTITQAKQQVFKTLASKAE